MGTWGIGSFENDDAADFMIDVLDSGDLSLIREVLDNVLTSTEYVEAPDAALAIVAAEIAAAAEAKRIAARSPCPSARPSAKAPCQTSPAPSVSTASTAKAGR